MEIPRRPALTGPEAHLDAPFGLPGLLRAQADRSPDAIACRDPGQQLTYLELDRLSDRLAASLLRRLGDQRGGVALCLPRGVDLMVALLGVLKAGCWYLPIALDEAEPRAAAMVAAARPVAAVLGAEAPAAFGALPRLSVPTVDEVAASADRRALPPVASDQPVYCLFTSGSTGQPKGALVGSDALVNRIQWMVRAFQFGSADVVLQKTPYTFDVSGWEFFAPLVSGGCCCFAPEHSNQDPLVLAALIERYQVTVCHFVPSMLAEFLARTEPGDGGSLRIIICSGEPLPAGLAVETHARFSAQLHNLYGPTEAAIDVTHWPVPADVTAADPVLIGAPIDNTELYVVDEAGKPVRPGDPGELWIGGTPVGLGYVNDPEQSAKAFLADRERRYYRTGDIVQQVGDQLRYLARMDDQVKVRGVRIELGEIEHALSAHPAVRRAVALPLDDGEGRTRIAAALVPAQVDQHPTSVDIRGFLRTRLPAAYLPEELHWLAEIPLGRAGKVDRRGLRSRLEQLRAEPRPVPGESRDRLAELWHRVLPERGGSAADGFLDLGGHSISAARFRASIRAELRRDVPLAKLLRDNASLAEVRSSLVEVEPPAPRPINPPGTSLPLTEDQRGIWLTCRLFRGATAAYHVVGALRLRGRLELAALRAAIAAVVARHDALRMRLAEPQPGAPVMLVDAATAPPLIVTDVDGALDDGRAAEFATRAGSTPMPVGGGALYRLELLTGADDACLVLSIHHLIGDQRTLDLLLADIAAGYAGALPTEPAPRFADHVQQRAEAAGGARWLADLDYWRRALAGAPTELGLPFRTTGRPRSLRGAVHSVDLGTARSSRVDGFRRRHRLTPAMFFLGVSGAVLAAWSGQEGVVIGVPGSRRETLAEWDTVGFFMATIPIRLVVGGHTDAAAFFAEVRHQQADAFAHATPAFSAIAEVAGQPARPDADPIFQAWFNDLTGQGDPPPWPGLDCRPVVVPTTGALYDLNIYLRSTADSGYRLELVRASDRIPAEVADELLAQCRLAVDLVLDRPDLPVDRWELRTTSVPGCVSLTDEPVAGSLTDPVTTESVAVRAGATTYTYAQLQASITELAETLTRAGVRPGEVVELRARRTAGLPVALLGAWQVGAVPALVDAGWPELRLVECAGLLGAAARLELDDGDAVRVIPGVAQPRRLAGVSHVLFTSGTTGTPAAVAIPSGSLEHALSWYEQALQPAGGDRFGLLSGVGHDPVLRDLLVPRRVGAELVIPEASSFTSPDRLFDFLVTAQITVLHATPALLELLVAAAAGRSGRLAALRLVVSGGAPLTAGLVRRLREFTDAAVINGYGATETPQLVTCHRVLERGEPAERLAGLTDGAVLPIGSETAGHQAVVVRADGAPVGIGAPGEIVVRGRRLPSGYLTGAGAGRFIADPFGDPAVRAFRTGDWGRVDPAGLLHVASRIDRQADIGGFRVALEEVEAVALRHPNVRQCVAGLAETAAGAVLALDVAPTAHGHLDEAEVRAHLRALLPRYAVPGRIRIVDRLALDHNHKAVLSQAAELPVAGVAGRTPPAEPASWLDEVLGELLGRQAGPWENLFDAGLTSIGLLRLHAALAERMPDPPSPIELFGYPNLQTLRRRVTQGPPRAAEAALAGRPRRRGTVDPAGVAEAARRRRAAHREGWPGKDRRSP